MVTYNDGFDNMKKKYRRVFCYTINGLIIVLALPMLLMSLLGLIGDWMGNRVFLPLMEWFKTILKIYDDDP